MIQASTRRARTGRLLTVRARGAGLGCPGAGCSSAPAPKLRAQYTDLPDGDAGVAKTIAIMRRYVNGNEGAFHPEIYALARQITSSLPSRDYAGEIRACFDWVQRN